MAVGEQRKRRCRVTNLNEERKIISKFNSRRGCLNTFTFPEMDHVPEIFTRGKTSEEHRTQIVAKIQKENSCVITGKKARYKDS